MGTPGTYLGPVKCLVKPLPSEEGVGYGVYDVNTKELLHKYIASGQDGDAVARFLANMYAKDVNEGIE